MVLNIKERMQIRFDLRQCSFSKAVLDKMWESLDLLFRQVEHFPIADVHVLIERNVRNNDYSVKVTLILPGETLVGNDHDQAVHAAFDRCLMGLAQNIRAYKDRLGQVPERQRQQKGTVQELEPTPPPDPAAIARAVRDANYTAFRTATFGYEEAVRKRVGRWIERYPNIDSQIGKGLTVEDIVEEVFLMAFEEYEGRPAEVRLGDWLDSLIDPAVRALQLHPEEELENINLVRSAREVEQDAEAR
jgi:ribosome-associated translation inhibitor RaiA